MTEEIKRRVYSAEEFAAAYGISRPNVYKMCQRGELPCIRAGTRYLIPIAALEAQERRLGELAAERMCDA